MTKAKSKCCSGDDDTLGDLLEPNANDVTGDPDVDINDVTEPSLDDWLKVEYVKQAGESTGTATVSGVCGAIVQGILSKTFSSLIIVSEFASSAWPFTTSLLFGGEVVVMETNVLVAT